MYYSYRIVIYYRIIITDYIYIVKLRSKETRSKYARGVFERGAAFRAGRS